MENIYRVRTVFSISAIDKAIWTIRKATLRFGEVSVFLNIINLNFDSFQDLLSRVEFPRGRKTYSDAFQWLGIAGNGWKCLNRFFPLRISLSMYRDKIKEVWVFTEDSCLSLFQTSSYKTPFSISSYFSCSTIFRRLSLGNLNQHQFSWSSSMCIT